MRFDLAIDDRFQSVDVPDQDVLGVLKQNEVQVERSGVEAVEYALEHPIGTGKLRELVRPGEKVVIITSDLTRPIPSYLVLPPVLRELEEAGCQKQDISIVFALGCHRFQTLEEMKKLVGEEVFQNYRCLDSDMADVIHMGTTKAGTPVDVFREVAQADRRICLGNIEYHYFAGYSGGAKAIMPGVSTRAAIQANHSKMVQEAAAAGNLDHNPVRDDLEEAIQYCPIDFIVNVVLDEKKKIIHAVAGHFIQAHREGCKFLDQVYLKEIPSRADIVLCSMAGRPKDLNLYQTQKALDNAKHAVKQGGIIILIGSCKEGLGEEVFEEWMLKAQKPQQLIEWIEENFELGGHKAAAMAMVMAKSSVFLVSDMPDAFVRDLFMEPFATVEEAYQEARRRLGEGHTSTLVMPYGGSTLPRCRQ